MTDNTLPKARRLAYIANAVALLWFFGFFYINSFKRRGDLFYFGVCFIPSVYLFFSVFAIVDYYLFRGIIPKYILRIIISLIFVSLSSLYICQGYVDNFYNQFPETRRYLHIHFNKDGTITAYDDWHETNKRVIPRDSIRFHLGLETYVSTDSDVYEMAYNE